MASSRTRRRILPLPGTVCHRERGGVVVPGGLEAAAFDVAKARIVRGEARPSDREALGHGWSGPAVGNAGPVGLGGALGAHGREVRLARGIMHLGQACSSGVRQRPTAPEHAPRRAPLGGVAIGVWEQTAAPALGHLGGIALVVWGLSAVDGVQRAGMTAAASAALGGTQGRAPVPGAHARDGHDETLARRGQSVQEGLRGGCYRAVHAHRAALGEQADVHGTGVEVDTAVKGGLSRGKSP